MLANQLEYKDESSNGSNQVEYRELKNEWEM